MSSQNAKDPNKILKSYENKTNQIVSKIFEVILRAQRKVDDKKYRQTIEKLK